MATIVLNSGSSSSGAARPPPSAAAAGPTPTSGTGASGSHHQHQRVPETWAVVAACVTDRRGRPLLLRTYCSPPAVVGSPEFPYQAHLPVSPAEDLLKIHFLLFASLDRVTAVVRQRNAAAAATDGSGGGGGGGGGDGGGGGAAAQQQPQQPQQLAAYNDVYPEYHSTPIPPPSGKTGNSATTSNSASSGAVAEGDAKAARDRRFLGKLAVSGALTSYGMRGATGLCTLLVATGAEVPRETMAPLCRAVHEAAAAAVCNPLLGAPPAYVLEAQEELYRRRRLEARLAQAPVEVGGGGGSGDKKDNRHLPSSSSASAATPAATGLVVSRPPALSELAPGVAEHSWPRGYGDFSSSNAHASSAFDELHPPPTLALSRAVNHTLESVIYPCSATVRSFILKRTA